MTSLREVLESRRQEQLLAKVAEVETAYADDPVRLQLLDEAVDMVKAAMASGEIPSDLSPADQFDLAVNMTEQAVAAAAEGDQAAEADEPEASEDDLAELEEAGYQAGEILKAAGVTEEDLEALTEDEQELLGELLARAMYGQGDETNSDNTEAGS